MIEHDELDDLVAKAFGAPAPESDSPAPLAPGCLPFWRFRPKPNPAWTETESAHVSSCRKCQGKLAALWETTGPGLAKLRQYVRTPGQFPFPRAMERYLDGPGESASVLVVKKLLEARTAVEQLGGRAARLFEPQDLTYGRADAPEPDERRHPPFLLAIPAGEGVPVEVSVWESDGELNIHGSAQDDSLKGKVLVIEIWDDFRNYSYRLPFKETGEGWAAGLREKIDPELDRSVRGGVVAVTSIEEAED